MAVRSSSADTHFGCPPCSAHVALEIWLSTPGAAVPLGALVSSSCTPLRISSWPTLVDGASSRATADAPDIRSLSW